MMQTPVYASVSVNIIAFFVLCVKSLSGFLDENFISPRVWVRGHGD